MGALAHSQSFLFLYGGKMKHRRTVLFILSLLCAGAVAILPSETGEMTHTAWKFCGCFLFLILTLIFRTMTDYAAMLTTMAMLCVLKVCSFQTVATAFSSSTIWLCIGVFLMGVGINNSGIGRRTALKILMLFPGSYRGNMSAMLISGLITTPMIPSAMAKTALMAPIIGEVCKSINAKPGSKQALGIWFPNFMCTCQLGMAFVSGSTNTVLMLGFIGISYTWLQWAGLALVWFISSVLLTCIFCLVYCSPEEGQERETNTYLKEQYDSLGRIRKEEKQGFVILGSSLLLFLTQGIHGIPAEAVSLLAVAAFSCCGLISREEVSSKGMWTTIIFVGGMLGLSDLIQSLGIGDWIASVLDQLFPQLLQSSYLFVPLLCVIIYLMRYILAAPMCCAAVFIAVLSPVVEQYGISRFVMVFVVWTSCCCWNAPYTNPAYTALISMTNGAIDDTTAKRGSYAYCVINLIALLICVPYWRMLGMC